MSYVTKFCGIGITNFNYSYVKEPRYRSVRTAFPVISIRFPMLESGQNPPSMSLDQHSCSIFREFSLTSRVERLRALKTDMEVSATMPRLYLILGEAGQLFFRGVTRRDADRRMHQRPSPPGSCRRSGRLVGLVGTGTTFGTTFSSLAPGRYRSLRFRRRAGMWPLLSSCAVCPWAAGAAVLHESFPSLRRWAAGRRTAERIGAILRDGQVDLVHGNSPRGAFYGGRAARCEGVPSIWHLRVHLRGGLRPWLLKQINDHWIAASGSLFRDAGIDHEHANAHVVPNGVPPGLIRGEPPVRWQHGDTGPTIGILGRLEPLKGQREFVEMACRLCEEGRSGNYVVRLRCFRRHSTNGTRTNDETNT